MTKHTGGKTIFCKSCKTPILKIGSADGARVLEATIVGWDRRGERVRLDVRCWKCKRRLRLPVTDVTHELRVDS